MRKIYYKKNLSDLSAKRKFLIYYGRFTLILKFLLVAIFTLLLVFKQFTGIFTDIRAKISEFLGDYGFELENVAISGQKNTTSSEIISSLNADVGTPIFSINLNSSSSEISKNPWVKNVIVQRKLPHTIIINLDERVPIALWQVKKELFVIDRDGEILKDVSPEKFSNFIHVVGDDANVYASELVDDLSTHPSLAGKILNAVRFGQRRWDLNFIENINVKMPQEDFKDAYNYLNKLNNEGKLFGNKIKIVDLRDKEKAYIEKLK